MSYTPPPPPPPPPGGGYLPPGGGYPSAAGGSYADVGPRIVAGLIDYVGPSIAVWVVVLVAGQISSALGVLLALVGYLGLFAFIIWNSGYQNGVTGQSIGKKMQNIKVVSETTGQPIGAGAGIGRYFLHFLDGFCFAGWIYGLFISPKKQTFADIIIKSVVVPA